MKGSIPRVYFFKISPNARTPQKIDRSIYELYSSESCIISPMQLRRVPTDLLVSIPEGHYGIINPIISSKNKKNVIASTELITYENEEPLTATIFNCSLPETLFNKNPSVSAFSGLFGSRLSTSIKQGDVIARLLIKKCTKTELYEEI